MPLPAAVPVTLTAAERKTLKKRVRGAKTPVLGVEMTGLFTGFSTVPRAWPCNHGAQNVPALTPDSLNRQIAVIRDPMLGAQSHCCALGNRLRAGRVSAAGQAVSGIQGHLRRRG